MHSFKNIFSLFFIYHSRLSAAMVRRRVFFGTVIQIFPTEGTKCSQGGNKTFPRREKNVPKVGINHRLLPFAGGNGGVMQVFCADRFVISIFFPKFVAMNETKWSENVILADADYVDKVAFDLIVNFERMLGRRIPPADMARWLECVALDGGLREKPQTDGATADNQEIQVVLIHEKEQVAMKNFLPSDYASQLNGQAFRDHLGEFCIAAYPVEAVTTKEDFFLDVLQTVGQQPEVKRLMVIHDAEHMHHQVASVLRHTDNDERRTTVFAMQPVEGGPFRQEILGYSLMAALGIRAEEISNNTK